MSFSTYSAELQPRVNNLLTATSLDRNDSHSVPFDDPLITLQFTQKNSESYAPLNPFETKIGQMFEPKHLSANKKTTPFSEYFNVIQSWEGYVIETDEERGVFLAHLKPVKGESGDLEAEIYLSEISEDDLPLVKPGAMFYWSIGYIIKSTGTKINASVIRFRRMPTWSKQDIEDAKKQVKSLRELFNA